MPVRRVVGIDLGATHVRVCAWDERADRPVAIPDASGVTRLPAAIAHPPDSTTELIVGSAALARIATSPGSGLTNIRPLLLALTGDTASVAHLDGVECPPRQAVSALLANARSQAEVFLGESVHDAVITVPPWFNEHGRQAVVGAASLAELHVVQLIDSTVAVVLGHQQRWPRWGESRVCAVVTLGGGSCSAAIVTVRGDTVDVHGSASEPRVGGLDFDDLIVRHVLRQVDQQSGVATAADAAAIQSIRREAELAKRRLSTLTETVITVTVGHAVSTLPISRMAVESVVSGLLGAVEACVRRAGAQAAEQSQIRVGSCSDILLAGGATHMPAVRTIVARALELDQSLIRPDDEENAIQCLGAGVAARGWALRGADPPGPIRGSRTASEPPGTLRHLDENVQFTVYRPHAIRPAVWYPLVAFAHLSERAPDAEPDSPDPVEEVKRQARQVLGERAADYQGLTQDSREAVPREGELTFLPEVPGLEFNPRSRTFLWMEAVHREEFRLRTTLPPGPPTLRGRLSVFLGAILLAEVPLRFSVDTGLPAASPLRDAVGARPYRRIFASYSHLDLWVVQEFERYAHVVGDRYLRDWIDLRAGEVWSDRLEQMITEADVFQLFWSSASMNSPFVRREWEYALSLDRPAFIRPVYWEDPLPERASPVLPPPALKRLHFSRLSLAAGSRPGAVTSARAEPAGPLADGAAETSAYRAELDLTGSEQVHAAQQVTVEYHALVARLRRAPAGSEGLDATERELRALHSRAAKIARGTSGESAAAGARIRDSIDGYLREIAQHREVQTLLDDVAAVMRDLKVHPIDSVGSAHRAAQTLRALRARAVTLKRGGPPEARQVLDETTRGIDGLLHQLAPDHTAASPPSKGTRQASQAAGRSSGALMQQSLIVPVMAGIVALLVFLARGCFGW